MKRLSKRWKTVKNSRAVAGFVIIAAIVSTVAAFLTNIDTIVSVFHADARPLPHVVMFDADPRLTGFRRDSVAELCGMIALHECFKGTSDFVGYASEVPYLFRDVLFISNGVPNDSRTWTPMPMPDGPPGDLVLYVVLGNDSDKSATLTDVSATVHGHVGAFAVGYRSGVLEPLQEYVVPISIKPRIYRRSSQFNRAIVIAGNDSVGVNLRIPVFAEPGERFGAKLVVSVNFHFGEAVVSSQKFLIHEMAG
jgi:hypothetical protein